MAKPAPQAFFSYSREDSDFVLRLAEDLKAAGAERASGSINWTSFRASGGTAPWKMLWLTARACW